MKNNLVKMAESWKEYNRYSIQNQGKPVINKISDKFNIVQVIASAKYLLQLIENENYLKDEEETEYNSTNSLIGKFISVNNIANSNITLKDYNSVLGMIEQLYLGKLQPSDRETISKDLGQEVMKVPAFKGNLNLIFSGSTHNLVSNKEFPYLIKNDIVCVESAVHSNQGIYGSGFYGKPLKTVEPISSDKMYLEAMVGNIDIK